MEKETKVYLKHDDENKLFPETQKYSTPQLEQVKYHLTCAAEIAEESGVFLKAAEIKQINADICHYQGKEHDAHLLEFSINDLKKRAKTKK